MFLRDIQISLYEYVFSCFFFFEYCWFTHYIAGIPDLGNWQKKQGSVLILVFLPNCISQYDRGKDGCLFILNWENHCQKLEFSHENSAALRMFSSWGNVVHGWLFLCGKMEREESVRRWFYFLTLLTSPKTIPSGCIEETKKEKKVFQNDPIRKRNVSFETQTHKGCFSLLSRLDGKRENSLFLPLSVEERFHFTSSLVSLWDSTNSPIRFHGYQHHLQSYSAEAQHYPILFIGVFITLFYLWYSFEGFQEWLKWQYKHTRRRGGELNACNKIFIKRKSVLNLRIWI